jgi:hypothetical protein
LFVPSEVIGASDRRGSLRKPTLNLRWIGELALDRGAIHDNNPRPMLIAR